MASTGLLGSLIQTDELDGSNPMVDSFTLESLMERNNYIPASTPDSEEDAVDEDATAGGESSDGSGT